MPELSIRPVEDGWVRLLTATDEELDRFLWREGDRLALAGGSLAEPAPDGAPVDADALGDGGLGDSPG